MSTLSQDGIAERIGELLVELHYDPRLRIKVCTATKDWSISAVDGDALMVTEYSRDEKGTYRLQKRSILDMPRYMCFAIKTFELDWGYVERAHMTIINDDGSEGLVETIRSYGLEK